LLDHRQPGVARRIHAVLIPAYEQEAALLQATHFAPLDRTAQDIVTSLDCYLGAFRGDRLVGVAALAPDDDPGQIQITTLIVHPQHQRQGTATALMAAVLAQAPDAVFSVATGAKNAPALALYRALGFVEYRWGTVGPEALPLVKLRRPAPDGRACPA
jgi:ribosomal protein S18 acetylase RimI-like enzyme